MGWVGGRGCGSGEKRCSFPRQGPESRAEKRGHKQCSEEHVRPAMFQVEKEDPSTTTTLWMQRRDPILPQAPRGRQECRMSALPSQSWRSSPLLRGGQTDPPQHSCISSAQFQDPLHNRFSAGKLLLILVSFGWVQGPSSMPVMALSPTSICAWSLYSKPLAWGPVHSSASGTSFIHAHTSEG